MSKPRDIAHFYRLLAILLLVICVLIASNGCLKTGQSRTSNSVPQKAKKKTAARPGTIRWVVSAETSDTAFYQPVIGEDNTLYVAGVTGAYGTPDPSKIKSRLYALSPEKETKWTFDCWLLGLPPLALSCLNNQDQTYALNKTLFLNAALDGVIALNQDGDRLWTYKPEKETVCRLFAGQDGSVYAALSAPGGSSVEASKLLALTPRGKKKWERVLNGALISSIVTTADGSIFTLESPGFSSSGARQPGSQAPKDTVTAINPDGSEKWHKEYDSLEVSGQIVARSNTLYFVENPGARSVLHALSSDGKEKYSAESPAGFLWSTLKVASDGSVCATASSPPSNKVVYLGPDGTKRWEHESVNPISPIAITGKNAYLQEDGDSAKTPDAHKIIALDVNGKKKWEFSASDLSTIVAPNGSIIVEVFAKDSDVRVLSLAAADGKVNWELKLPEREQSSEAAGLLLSSDGTLYAYSQSNIYAINTRATM